MSNKFRINPDFLELADKLHSAAIHLLRKLRREDESSGLNAQRLSALSVIVFAGPLSLGDLAAAEQVRPPTMTRIVNALETPDARYQAARPADARIVRLAATTKGKALYWKEENAASMHWHDRLRSSAPPNKRSFRPQPKSLPNSSGAI